MAEFDEDGIQKLAETYHGDIQSLLDRMEAVVDAGKSYHTFTPLSDDMDGTVKFIIRTEAVTAE
jgi:putative membrane protein